MTMDSPDPGHVYREISHLIQVASPINPPPPALRISGSIRINESPICGPLTLDIPSGQWTCILGPSAAGKSTLLRLLAGVDPKIRINGTLDTSDHKPLEGRIAMMTQTDSLMPWLSVKDNASLGMRLRGEPIDESHVLRVLQSVGLGQKISEKPNRLSGGQKKRVSLARSFLEARPVILLDEPFAALDIPARIKMQNLAAHVLQGRTVVHVTHDTAEAARLGHRIFLLSPAGASEVPIHDTHPPRPPDAQRTLELQGQLFHRLMQMV